MLGIGVRGERLPKAESCRTPEADHEDQGLKQAEERVVVAEREGAGRRLRNACERAAELVMGDVDDAEARVEAQPLVRDDLANHLLLDDGHGQVQVGRDLQPTPQAEHRELHREDLLVRVVGVHAHREELRLAEAHLLRRVQLILRGLQELAPLLHPAV